MGKRLSKGALLEEIRIERGRLDALLAEISPREMTRAGVTAAGWSVKEILGHVVGWQKLNLTWHEVGERGEIPDLPAPGFTWKEIRKLNDAIYREYRRRSLKAVVEEYAVFHEKMLALINKVPDQRFAVVGSFSWTGPTWSLSDYVRANTASHYRWACKHIRKWKRLQEKGGT